MEQIILSTSPKLNQKALNNETILLYVVRKQNYNMSRLLLKY